MVPFGTPEQTGANLRSPSDGEPEPSREDVMADLS
jgi:hypothetical protein